MKKGKSGWIIWVLSGPWSFMQTLLNLLTRSLNQDLKLCSFKGMGRLLKEWLDDDNPDNDSTVVIMKIRRRKLVGSGRERKSTRTFFFPLMCLTSNFHCSNWFFYMINQGYGTVVFFDLSIVGKFDISIFMRKYVASRWNLNFSMAFWIVRISLKVEW